MTVEILALSIRSVFETNLLNVETKLFLRPVCADVDVIEILCCQLDVRLHLEMQQISYLS